MDYSKLSDAEIAQRAWFWWQHNIGHDNTLCGISGDKFLYVKAGIWTSFDPCNNESDAWPIIFNHDIGLRRQSNGVRSCSQPGGKYPQYSESPLRAAMICYLMMQEGE